jgi:DNA replication initiation complex subunit (GINS family)
MLTFEKIRELERVEREGKKLQKLPDDVIEQINDYMQRKEKTKEKTSADIMELENVKNTIKRFFELREHKLILAALDTVRTGLPPENLTKQEERTFYELVDVSKRHREQFFHEIGREKVTATDEKGVYRVKKSLPEFVGPDMKIYKLTENELVSLPVELEPLLLKEGVIEKVEKG